MRRFILLLCLLPLFAAALPTAPASAADSKRLCFAQVPDCIEFRFRTFWSGNGGRPVFGLPLTTDRNEKVGNEKYKVQYFERFRFEQHKENPEPYDVLLGRIGVDRLAAQGRDWQTFAKANPSAPHYFAETGHAIAPQFWGFWSRNGLEFDGNKKAKSAAESLALFGFPVSEAQMEQGSDGQMYLTQWFERARFEFHPENKAPYDVLLGRLGADALTAIPAQSGSDPVPAPAIGCPENAPTTAEGPQAWVANPQPQAPGALRVTPLETAAVAGRSVPIRWRVQLPEKGVDVTTRALNPEAWMDTRFPYWEGPIRFEGTHAGRGYLEMTGYR
jgi:hypothetical protein